jgi:hypothetical protein
MGMCTKQVDAVVVDLVERILQLMAKLLVAQASLIATIGSG